MDTYYFPLDTRVPPPLTFPNLLNRLQSVLNAAAQSIAGAQITSLTLTGFVLLPDDITSASSLSVFRKKLKTHLFHQSYRDVIL